MVNVVKTELDKYPSIKKYFGSLVEKALQEPNPAANVLVALLSDPAVETKKNMAQLESVLRVGDSDCEYFNDIFSRIAKLDICDLQDANEVSNVILDILAEVEGFGYLHDQSFTHIAYVLPTPAQSTPDFTAFKEGQLYAVEVSRLALPQSQRKKVKPFVSTPSFVGLSGKNAREPFVNSLLAKIKAEYSQHIEPFCRAQSNSCYGIVIVSTGRGFFSSRWARKDFWILPEASKKAVPRVWHELHICGNYSHLYSIVFIDSHHLFSCRREV
jgi:hypothetical protein